MRFHPDGTPNDAFIYVGQLSKRKYRLNDPRMRVQGRHIRMLSDGEAEQLRTAATRVIARRNYTHVGWV